MKGISRTLPFYVALLTIVKNDRMIDLHWALKHIALKYS